MCHFGIEPVYGTEIESRIFLSNFWSEMSGGHVSSLCGLESTVLDGIHFERLDYSAIWQLWCRHGVNAQSFFGVLRMRAGVTSR